LNCQVKGFDDENVEHFDLVESIRKVDEKFIKQLLYFFGLNNKIEIGKNSILMLTQHFSNLKMMSFEEQKELYLTVVDYFNKDK
ncbi:hypothetical protein, partial [Escherichia coli]|uniref:hypothetical protein n=1 Tax=Escherichia coli TaxID=562 RepID=UPI00215B0CF2